MSSYQPKNTCNKIDWFVNGILQQTFESYKHAADFFKKEYNFIKEVDIKNIINKKKNKKFKKIQILKDDMVVITFNDNIEFAHFYNISEQYACNIINGKIKYNILKDYKIQIINTSPDIRLHVYEKTNIYRICSNCEESKLLTEQNFPFVNKITKTYRTKCNKCSNKIIGNKNIDKFKENLKNSNENWKPHPEYKNIYFERDTTKIYNITSGKYIICNLVINNKEMVNRNLKWEAFNEKIPENKIVNYKNTIINLKDNDGTELDNLECVYVYCGNCEIMVENPKDKKYCSKNCQNIFLNNKEKNNRNTNLKLYILHIYSIQKNVNKKYKMVIDYDIEYLISLGINCFYCNISCKFGYEKENWDPDTLSFDKKNPDKPYIKENVVTCCWFCNRMKNQTSYNDWEQFIIFIKDKNKIELDLSNKSFAKKSSEINMTNILYHVKQKSPSYYPTLQDTKQTFLNLIKKQNYLDPFFNFFPIIYLDKNCLFNASIDAIDTSLPENEKHRPDNLQIIPKCFNYGKSILSNCQFIEEWEKRGFKTDFTDCNVKLPENYLLGYFNKLI